MKCPRCQHENQPGAKFCQECATPLARMCSNCGSRLPEGAKFCPECAHLVAASPGTSPRFASPESYTPKHLAERILTSKSGLEGERKQVTVLFADLKGSMELLADRDPEEARKLLDPVLEKTMEAVHRYEGTVNQVMGDGIMALFGAPIAQEDHAVRACYAALRMQDSVKRYATEVFRIHGVSVRMRVGINSGEVVVRSIGSDLHMDYTAVGQTTHLAARMEQLADPGSTLLTAETLQLAEGFVQVTARGPAPVKGLSEPVEVFELTGAGSARTRLQATAARGLSRFVGRSAEVAQMQAALERARSGHGEVVAVIGEPGVGKSRLVWELTHSHRTQGMLVLESSSVSYGKASLYRPLIDLLKGYFEIEDRDDPRRVREKVTGKLLTLDRALEPNLPALLALLDVPVEDALWERLDPIQRRSRILDACRRLLLREARVQPLLIVFEDLHWVDSETQAFLDALVESLPTVRVLLLTNYRPEYQHRWASKSYYTQIRVDPLPPESAAELLDGLLGDDRALAPLRSLLIERTACNPLFMEESVRALVETGVLAGSRGAYRLMRSIGALSVPATVQAVLAARIDRLSAEDKRLLQAASVIGKDVPLALLHEIAGLPETELRERLAVLQEAEFLYEASLFPDPEYTFKHALTHDVAYNGILQERRKPLHAQILQAMERLYADRLVEQIDRLGHHAFLGEMWDKALLYLRQAGEKALSRSASRTAVATFDQALSAARRLPETREVVEQMIDVHLSARLALTGVGELARALHHNREAIRLAEAIDDQRRLAWAWGVMTVSVAAAGDLPEGVRCAERSAAIATSLDHPISRIAADFYLGWGYRYKGDFPRAIDVLTRGSAQSRPGLAGRSDARDASWHPAYSEGFLYVMGLAEAVVSFAELGHFKDAVERGREAMRAGEDMGLTYPFGFATHRLGYAYVLKGDIDQALPLLEQCRELAERADVPVLTVHLGSCLGQAYCLEGRGEAAVAFVEKAHAMEEAGGNKLWEPVNLATLATAYSLLGRSGEALTTAERALDCARRFGQRGSEAGALFTLGEVLAACEPQAYARCSEMYEAALALATELKMRPLIARCHLALAMLQEGKATDRLQHRNTAGEMFRELGMQFWLEKAESAM